MTRRPRIQIPGGTYHVLQATNRHQPLFVQDHNYTHLAALLAGTVRRTGTRVFAYCWLPHELHLAVRSADIPLSRFMQGFTSRYARYVHGQTHDHGHLFSQRFQSLLIDPTAWLPALVRYIHHAPVRAGASNGPQDFAHSSHAAYAGSKHPLWLHVDTVVRLLHDRGISSQLQRDTYFATQPTQEDLELFGRNGALPTRILGDAEFSQRLPHAHRPRPSRLSLSQLIDAIAISQSATRDDILSLSRSRRLALARALIAWHATERRIATLAQVARYLRRDPSTLSKAITRHRPRHPDLFQRTALHYLTPLA